MTPESPATVELPASPAVACSDGFGALDYSSWRYSVIRERGDHTRQTVATGLTLTEARSLADRLDREYRERVEASGKYYSSWTADLHELQLESPNDKLSHSDPP